MTPPLEELAAELLIAAQGLSGEFDVAAIRFTIVALHVRRHPMGQAHDLARQSALEHLLTTFFDGSAADAVSALLEDRGDELPAEDLERLEALIRQAKREGR